MAHIATISTDRTAFAAIHATAEGLFRLGIDHAAAAGERADLIAAHKWFNLAALRGNPEAAYHRQQIAEEMSEAEIAEAQRAAREWLRAQTH